MVVTSGGFLASAAKINFPSASANKSDAPSESVMSEKGKKTKKKEKKPKQASRKRENLAALITK